MMREKNVGYCCDHGNSPMPKQGLLSAINTRVYNVSRVANMAQMSTVPLDSNQ